MGAGRALLCARRRNVCEVTTKIRRNGSIRNGSNPAWYDFQSAKLPLDGAAVTQIPACKHEHTRLIAKDNEAEYVECVHCGAILETHELAETAEPGAGKSNPPEPAKSNPFDESLSDA